MVKTFKDNIERDITYIFKSERKRINLIISDLRYHIKYDKKRNFNTYLNYKIDELERIINKNDVIKKVKE